MSPCVSGCYGAVSKSRLVHAKHDQSERTRNRDRVGEAKDSNESANNGPSGPIQNRLSAVRSILRFPMGSAKRICQRSFQCLEKGSDLPKLFVG